MTKVEVTISAEGAEPVHCEVAFACDPEIRQVVELIQEALQGQIDKDRRARDPWRMDANPYWLSELLKVTRTL